jgi:TonB family protein
LPIASSKKTEKVDCKPGKCIILITNFTLPSGATSRLGMQIADQVSKELASQQNAIKAAKFNGTVIMAVTVSAEGRTIEARVARGAPYGVNETALKAVLDWQFKPARREGVPVTCMVMIEATFRLY